MVKAGKGKIINIASNMAQVPAAHVIYAVFLSARARFTPSPMLWQGRSAHPASTSTPSLPGYTASEASLNQQGSEKTFEFATGEQAFARRGLPTDMVGSSRIPRLRGIRLHYRAGVLHRWRHRDALRNYISLSLDGRGQGEVENMGLAQNTPHLNPLPQGERKLKKVNTEGGLMPPSFILGRFFRFFLTYRCRIP